MCNHVFWHIFRDVPEEIAVSNLKAAHSCETSVNIYHITSQKEEIPMVTGARTFKIVAQKFSLVMLTAELDTV
jgi:hypothetical protein